MRVQILSEGPIDEALDLLGHRQELQYSITVQSKDGSRTHTQKGADREACLWGIRENSFILSD